MFENLFNKRISTKNLYIVSLRQCVAVDLMQYSRGIEFTFKALKNFCLVRKIEKNFHTYYQDIFTKTLYESNPSYFEVDNIYIYNIRPVSLTKSYITYKETIKVFNVLNNISKDSEKSNQSFQKTKKY